MHSGSEGRVDLLCGEIAGAGVWYCRRGVWDSPQRRECLNRETPQHPDAWWAGADWQKSPVAQMFARRWCRGRVSSRGRSQMLVDIGSRSELPL